MAANPIAVLRKIIEAEKSFADFIQNGPADGLGGFARDGYRTRCEQFANAPPWARLLARGPAGSLGRVCKPYLDDIGADLPEITPPPFAGGQCEDVQYNVFARGLPAFGGEITQQSGAVFGPIVGILRTPTGGGGGVFIGLQARDTLTTAFGVTTSEANAPSWRIINVVRVDGQPDNCGDPPDGPLRPGPNPPPNPPPTPGPEPTADPGNPTGVPLLPIPEYDDPIGGPVPFEAEPDGTGGVGPEDIPGNTDSQEGGAENYGDAIAGGSGTDVGSDDIDFGEPPTGRVWVGALFQFAIPTDYGDVPGSRPTNTVVPRVFGNCSLTYDSARGTAVRVNSANVELFRPNGALKVTGVFVNSLPGITFNVRPVSVAKCPENSCGAE